MKASESQPGVDPLAYRPCSPSSGYCLRPVLRFPGTMAGSGRKWPEVAGSGRKWPEVAGSGRKWPEVAGSGRKWPEVAGSGRKWPEVAGSGRKWPEVAGSGRKWPEVAGSGRKWPEVAGSGRKWPEVAGSGRKWPEVAGSGRKWPEVAGRTEYFGPSPTWESKRRSRGYGPENGDSISVVEFGIVNLAWHGAWVQVYLGENKPPEMELNFTGSRSSTSSGLPSLLTPASRTISRPPCFCRVLNFRENWRLCQIRTGVSICWT